MGPKTRALRRSCYILADSGASYGLRQPDQELFANDRRSRPAKRLARRSMGFANWREPARSHPLARKRIGPLAQQRRFARLARPLRASRIETFCRARYE